MGFIKEIYSDNRAGLVVAFGRGKTTENYFSGDSIEEAMKHFNIYLKGNEMFVKTENEVAISNLGIKIEDATEFRSAVNNIIEALSDEQASSALVLFPIWQVNKNYTSGERIRYNNKIYKVLQDHTSQANWTPTFSPSLFTALLIDEESNNILNWVQPDSTNSYKNGDKVYHNDKFWISTMDGNIWEPGAVNAPWKEYIVSWENGIAYALNQKVLYDSEIYVSLIEKNTKIPTDISTWEKYQEPDETLSNESTTEEDIELDIPEWVQPDNDSAYSIGDKVTYDGKIYESLIDNNVWSPEAYPAGWSEVIAD